MGGADKGGGKGRGMGPRGKYAFKVLCPDTLVTCVLGRGGSYKDQLQDESGCKISLSNRDEFFPNSNFRILVVYGPTSESVMMVLEKLVEKVIECGEQELKTMPAEPEFLGKGPGEFIFRACISEKMFPGLIGTKGSNITAIRHEFNAKVFVDNDRLQGHQLVRVIAEPDGLQKALQRIHDYVQEHVEEDWFPDWTMVRNFDPTERWEGSWQGERERSPRRGGGGGGSWNNARQEKKFSKDLDGFVQDMSVTASEFSQEYIDAEHIITCDLPKQKVTALIGKKGEYSKKVRAETGTQVTFGKENEHGLQTLEIKGPLLQCYAAHALMMRRYHETEPAAEPEAPAPAADNKAQQIAQLQEQMQKLQEQLARVKQK
mmetsp:Transcript_39190/g.61057  ORF Transcript_39190/g.61057 Transcript_39190/m.61057 type:complete len:374 (+) Transcript_39190:72-1193(+)